MNQIHGRFEIANDDFLYVLSAMVLEPLRWNERFGWRRLIEAERQADVPLLARDRPPDGDQRHPGVAGGARALQRRVRATRFAATDAGRRLARSQLGVFLAWFPVVPNRLGARDLGAARRARRRGARPRAAHARRAARGRGRAWTAGARRPGAAAAPPASPAHDAPTAKLPGRLRRRGARTAARLGATLTGQGPVAQRIERQTSNLRAEVRFLPGHRL